MLVGGLRVPIRILTMSLSRAGMHFRFIVLALIVVMGGLSMMMGSRLVF